MSRKTLEDLSGWLGCASTQCRSARASREEHRGIVPPATLGEVWVAEASPEGRA